jgi:peptidyl-dipeptidase A
MRYMVKAALFVVGVLVLMGCGKNAQEVEMQKFIDDYLSQVQPLAKEAALAYWQAATVGDEASFEKYSEFDLQIRQLQSDTAKFAQLESLRASGEITDAHLNRQLDLIYNAYLPNQIDAELLESIVRQSSVVEQKFSTFRGEMNGKKLSNNDIDNVLKNETNSRIRKETWEASKQVGAVVATDVIELARLRNESAYKLGFSNYHTMSLASSEQDPNELDAIFADLEELTTAPFAALKSELDEVLADMYGVGVDGLMPWHYHDAFFQETPQVYSLDLDAYYADKDVVELSKQFYAGINMPVDDILQNSDLYERDGKNPHAFCTDIDRKGDVRILCNVKNNERWMETMMHELGHAVYDKFHDSKMPYLLREPAHQFTTEGIAMFFGRLSRNPFWMQQMLGLSDEDRNEIALVAGKYMQLKQLIFARWAMVMYNFEKELYANPDQDLNALWWNLVERFQMVKKPAHRDAPDWAAKIHVALYPVYYHNYLLGELFASQMHNHIVHNILHLENDASVSYVESMAVGEYLAEKIFEPGSEVYWNKMIENATGEPLSAAFFVEQFVR